MSSPPFDPVLVATTHLLFTPLGDVKLAQLAVIFAELDWIIRQRNSLSSGGLSPRKLPVIVCGDMNFEPYCSIFNFAVDGFIKYGGVHVDPNYSSTIQKMPSNSDPSRKYPSLLPPSVGITDKCTISDQPQSSQGDGILYHSLHLKSAYHMDYKIGEKTNGEGDAEDGNVQPAYEFMTTHHDRASNTVDFIFFNENPKFQLVNTWSIPRIGCAPKIPDEGFGSDHFSVAANFILLANENGILE